MSMDFLEMERPNPVFSATEAGLETLRVAGSGANDFLLSVVFTSLALPLLILLLEAFS